MKRFAVLALAASALILVFSCASAPAKPAAVAEPAAPPPGPAASAPDAPAEAPAELSESLKPYAAASKDGLVVIEVAQALEAEGKWKSAYQALDRFDPANADPFALAMKTGIMIKGSVRSDMHRSFGLADLEEGQDLDSLRNAEGEYSPLPFDPPALADALAAKGIAAPGILSKELGDYYVDVLGRFSGQWAISDEEILAKIAEHYGRAFGDGVFDGASLVNQAETLVRLNRGDEADPIYRKAMELDPASASLLFSYASSLAFRGKKAEALPEVDKAIAAYGEDQARINAIALGARIGRELGDESRAESYFALVEKLYPDTPTPGVMRHLVAVEVGDKAGALAAAEGLVAAYGSNPAVVRTMISTWYSAGEVASARDFLQGAIGKGGDDMTVATLDFYFAVLLAQGGPSEADRALALKALDEGEAKFKTALGADHEVFGVIAEIRAALQAQAGQEPQAPEAQ